MALKSIVKSALIFTAALLLSSGAFGSLAKGTDIDEFLDRMDGAAARVCGGLTRAEIRSKLKKVDGGTSYASQYTESLMLLITLRSGSADVKSAAAYLALRPPRRHGGREDAQYAIDVSYFRALCRQLITAADPSLTEIKACEIAETLEVDGDFEEGGRHNSAAFNGNSYIMKVYRGGAAVMVVTGL